MHTVISDNEPALRSKEFTATLHHLQAEQAHSTPFSPQTNGVAERFMRTLGDHLRTNLEKVDYRLWDYCVEYLEWNWNRIPRPNFARAPQYNGKTPLEAVHSYKVVPPARANEDTDNIIAPPTQNRPVYTNNTNFVSSELYPSTRHVPSFPVRSTQSFYVERDEHQDDPNLRTPVRIAIAQLSVAITYRALFLLGVYT